MEQVIDKPQGGDEGGRALAIIKAAMAMPGAKVDREAFLRDQLKSHCPEPQVDLAIEFNPAYAQIPLAIIDKIADSVIRWQYRKAAAGSFVAGMPGGIFMGVTIPADIIQSTWHTIVLAQKLAYLYGWPNLMDDGSPDEETQMRILMLLGVMHGSREAKRVVSGLASLFANEVARQLPKQALTKTAYYPIIKQVLKWFGVKLTKTSFAHGVAKIIPIVSGGISATVTGTMQRKMAHRLKNHLRELEFAKPSQTKETIIIEE